MRIHSKLAILAALFLLWAPIANAGVTIDCQDDENPFVDLIPHPKNPWEKDWSKGADRCEILITGTIDHQTYLDFKKASEDPRFVAFSKRATERAAASGDLELDSPGGSGPDAMAIGRMVRAKAMETVVPRNGQCSSACVLILAGGVVRVAAGRVVIHRPRFTDNSGFANLPPGEASKRYEQLLTEMRQYLREMGITDAFYDHLHRVPSDEGETLTVKQLLAYGLHAASDPAWDEWQSAKVIELWRKAMEERQKSPKASDLFPDAKP